MLPSRIRNDLRRIKGFLRHSAYRGEGRYCPICRKASRKFGPNGVPPRLDVRCMYCGAVERHRLMWRFIEEKTDLFDGREKRMLHVAAEPFFESSLKARIGEGYVTADLFNPNAMEKMDITDIQHPDNTFDVIFCSHVLEHVLDDRRAMREFARVLKPSGWSILLVPITAEETFEDASIVDPQLRLKMFGQEDHVRRYGPDFCDRLVESGLNVSVYEASGFLTEDEIKESGIDRSEEIYFCTKRE